MAGWEHLWPVGRDAWRLDSILWLYLGSETSMKMKNADCSVAKRDHGLPPALQRSHCLATVTSHLWVRSLSYGFPHKKKQDLECLQ